MYANIQAYIKQTKNNQASKQAVMKGQGIRQTKWLDKSQISLLLSPEDPVATFWLKILINFWLNSDWEKQNKQTKKKKNGIIHSKI